jgi:hypothetical protein
MSNDQSSDIAEGLTLTRIQDCRSRNFEPFRDNGVPLVTRSRLVDLCNSQLRAFAPTQIFRLRHGFQMRRIDASRHPTQMVNLKTRRDWSNKDLIKNAIGQAPPTCEIDPAVVLGCVSTPNPTGRRIAARLNQKALRNTSPMVTAYPLRMPQQVFLRLSSDISSSRISVSGWLRRLPTTAVAQAVGNRITHSSLLASGLSRLRLFAQRGGISLSILPQLGAKS